MIVVKSQGNTEIVINWHNALVLVSFKGFIPLFYNIPSLFITRNILWFYVIWTNILLGSELQRRVSRCWDNKRSFFLIQLWEWKLLLLKHYAEFLSQILTISKVKRDLFSNSRKWVLSSVWPFSDQLETFFF